MTQKNDFSNSTFTNNSINNIDLSTINNFYQNHHSDINDATYKTESVWKSPVTMATLTWLSVPSSILAIFSVINIVIQMFYKTNFGFIPHTLFILSFFVTGFLLSLISITKRHIRIPLPIQNYALNGFGNQLMLEKIIPNPCPQCGGKMRYYKKLLSYEEIIYPNGATKKINKKFAPVLECLRNSEHLYIIDIAEEPIDENN
ncbi:hypothetical protein [Moraxella sp.]|uniref:hypothetical protein n=1 Tax=Moraxella sp. TaxID=479 RepID=UPI0026DC3F34|nr:hypothetical protein [Moraxella sp.]MDO4894590.1 hypothetical protein [Moraxella sp.]